MMPSSKQENKPPCKFYSIGQCKFGDNCKHYHPKPKPDKGPDNQPPKAEQPGTENPRPASNYYE